MKIKLSNKSEIDTVFKESISKRMITIDHDLSLLEKKNSQLEELYSRNLEKIKFLRNIRQEYLTFSETEWEKFSKSLYHIVNNNYIQKVFRVFYAGREGLIARTNRIWIFDFDRELKYDFGEYRIQLSLIPDTSKRIQIFNNERNVQDFCHPHILENIPCLGTIALRVQEELSSHNWMKVLLMLYVFLCSYDKETCHILIESWKENSCALTKEDRAEKVGFLNRILSSFTIN